MELNNIYKVKHELWLKVLFASFAIKDEKIKSEIYEFSQIQFRHLKWLSNECKANNIAYDYNRFEIDIRQDTQAQYFQYRSKFNGVKKDEVRQRLDYLLAINPNNGKGKRLLKELIEGDSA